jgi:hypothetical protein
MLFDLATDPNQEHPIVDDNVELQMMRMLIEWMRWNDTPPEQFERLGLPIEGEIRPEHLQCGPRISETTSAGECRAWHRTDRRDHESSE